MNIIEAVKELRAGKKIKKANWKRDGYIEWDEYAYKFYFKILDTNYKGEWIANVDDLTYEDYKIWGEPEESEVILEIKDILLKD